MLKNLIIVCLIAVTSQVLPAFGSKGLAETPAVAKSQVAPPDTEAVSWMLVDHNSGWILAEHNAHQRIEPASLTKIMTSYVVFDLLQQGTLKLADSVYVSEKAWRTGGSRMFIQVDTQVTVEELLKGLIIQSGNDAAVALAEHVAGSEAAFAKIMNEASTRLGMAGTHFTNSTGLPDEDHYTTTYDLTLLTRAMIMDHPEYYSWHAIKEFTYNDITQKNRNLLLWRDDSVDGVKTGHTESAGYCLIGSARRDNMRLIATLVGARSQRYRANAVQGLLRYGFNAYQSYRVFDAGARVAGIDVYMGEEPEVAVGSPVPIDVTIPKNGGDLKAEIAIPEYKIAPVNPAESLGSLTVRLNNEPILSASLFALRQINEGPWWQRLLDRVKLWIL